MVGIVIYVHTYNYYLLLAIQQLQANPWLYYSVIQQMQQTQMETSRPQVYFQQQEVGDVVSTNNVTFTSVSPAFVSVPATSQPVCSLAAQSMTVHTPVATVQSNAYNHQKMSHSKNSVNGVSALSSPPSQVCVIS